MNKYKSQEMKKFNKQKIKKAKYVPNNKQKKK